MSDFVVFAGVDRIQSRFFRRYGNAEAAKCAARFVVGATFAGQQIGFASVVECSGAYYPRNVFAVAQMGVEPWAEAEWNADRGEWVASKMHAGNLYRVEFAGGVSVDNVIGNDEASAVENARAVCADRLDVPRFVDGVVLVSLMSKGAA